MTERGREGRSSRSGKEEKEKASAVVVAWERSRRSTIKLLLCQVLKKKQSWKQRTVVGAELEWVG